MCCCWHIVYKVPWRREMPFMHPQIQFKAGFFWPFHFISITLCYGHFIHALDMPGDAECVSGMSHDLSWHRAENTLQAEMKVYFSAACKYWVRWPDELSTQLRILHAAARPKLCRCDALWQTVTKPWQYLINCLCCNYFPAHSINW